MNPKTNSNDTSVRPKIRSKHSEKQIGEPLEKKTIRFEDRDHFERNYPALDSKFSVSMVFIKYCKPPTSGDDIHTRKWISSLDNFEQMIKTLLGLPQNQFWSTLLHQKSLQTCLESYLRLGPRNHDLDDFMISDQMKVSIKRVHGLVFKLYVRICSFAESKTFISEKTFGGLIYDNYLLDIPIIIDLSVLYVHTEYKLLLMQMLSNVMSCQPQYEDDLLKACVYIREDFDLIQDKLVVVENHFETKSKLSSIPLSELQYLVSQINDISCGLYSLLQSLPRVSHHYRTASIDKTIVEFYNRVFPYLQNELDLRIADQYRRQLMKARSYLINTFRDIIKICFIDELMNANSTIDSKVCLIDELIETLTLAAYEKSFITDYCTKYPVEKYLLELSNNSKLTEFENFDKTRIDYLKSVIQSSITYKPKQQNVNYRNENEEKVNGFSNTDEINGEMDIALESSIQYIQEIIPELGKGFIHKCLEFYNMDNEKVLNAILEQNLPPQLSSLDKSLQIVPKKQSKNKTIVSIEANEHQNTFPLPEVIDERHNVYNNDEFDIFRNKNIDLSRIHLGKKDREHKQLDNETKEKIMSINKQQIDEEMQMLYDYDDDFEDTFQNEPQIDLPNDKLIDELDLNVGNNSKVSQNPNKWREKGNQNRR